ncbi:MAG: DUF6034 family protein [Lachnospiraceae bacterium]|nr:DUF6034 family protein [Lachnospiraceae bacterium]
MKNRRRYLALLLSAMLLSGCAATPDSSIVRQKGSQSQDNYREADDGSSEETGETQNVSGVEVSLEDEPDTGSIDQEDTVSGNAENVLATRLGVPDTYTATASTSDGSFTMTSNNAMVEVPDVSQVPVYSVSQMEFTQEFIDLVTEAFFGESPVYDYAYYYQTTKTEALEKLNELKEYQAEGNTDPYGYIEAARESGAFEEGSVTEDDIFNLQEEIDEWEQVYAEAPETVEKTEVTPGFGVTSYEDENGNTVYYEGYFNGFVETEDGLFSYILKSSSPTPMSIKISRYADKEELAENVSWKETCYDSEAYASNAYRPTQEKCEELAGITVEEAIAVTDTYMEQLGLSDEFSVGFTTHAWRSLESDLFTSYTYTASYIDGGWYIVYTRTLDGIPVTYEMKEGGGLESMESTTEPWCYELVTFIVNADGLQEAEIQNLYEVGEKKYENVDLLSFSEIAEIFEQMIVIQNTDSYEDSASLEITEVTLGYMRIYDPGADSRSGTLVPVWDFFGSEETHSTYDGVEYTSYIDYPGNSFLTINAADGTIIDRSLGY